MELIFYEDNWADEMDINCIHVVPTGFYDQFIQAAEALYDVVMKTNKNNYRTPPTTLNFYVGTNEDVDFNRDSFRSRFTKTAVVPEDIETVKKYLNFKSFGNDVMYSILDRAVDELPLELLKTFDILAKESNWRL